MSPISVEVETTYIAGVGKRYCVKDVPNGVAAVVKVEDSQFYARVIAIGSRPGHQSSLIEVAATPFGPWTQAEQPRSAGGNFTTSQEIHGPHYCASITLTASQ